MPGVSTPAEELNYQTHTATIHAALPTWAARTIPGRWDRVDTGRVVPGSTNRSRLFKGDEPLSHSRLAGQAVRGQFSGCQEMARNISD